MATNTAGGDAEPAHRSASRSPRAAWATGPITRDVDHRAGACSTAPSTTTRTARSSRRTATGAVGGNGAVRRGRALDPRRRHGAEARRRGRAAASTTGCRVCHSVARRRVARSSSQHGDNYGVSSAYDLAPSGAHRDVMTHERATVPRRCTPTARWRSPTGGLLLPLPDDATPIADLGPQPRHRPRDAGVLARRHAGRRSTRRRPASRPSTSSTVDELRQARRAPSPAPTSSSTTPAADPAAPGLARVLPRQQVGRLPPPEPRRIATAPAALHARGRAARRSAGRTSPTHGASRRSTTSTARATCPSSRGLPSRWRRQHDVRRPTATPSATSTRPRRRRRPSTTSRR